MSYLDRLKAEFPENTLDRQLPKLPKPPYGSNGSSPPGHFSEIEGTNKADADRAATVQAEAADLREAFEERAGILEHDAGLPRPEAELEAARITATYARNRGYLWASLRAALAEYPVLLPQLPDGAGPVDSLPLGVAKVAVLKGGRVVRQRAYTVKAEVKDA